MAARSLLLFRHKDRLGNAPAHSLFERVTAVRPDADPDKPPRQFADYEIRFDGAPLEKTVKPGASKDLENGVTLIRRI